MCGTRATEACGLYLQDFDLSLDDEHVRVHGKGGTVRTVLLDDRGYVALLRLYLARTGYTAGPMFRASINGTGGPLSYSAAHHRVAKVLRGSRSRHRHPPAAPLPRHRADQRRGLHRSRTQTPRHASTETTQIYALLADKVADAEIRAARRPR